jgi:hypothetical protein
MRTQRKASEEKLAITEPIEPKWLTDMRKHFQRTGAYRGDDLRRLLGDPRQAVQTETAPAFCYAAAQAPKAD